MGRKRGYLWKKGITAAAAMVLGCSACPALPALAEGEGTALGRYLETEVELPEEMGMVLDLEKLSDGRLRIAALGDAISLWDSSDGGGTWELAACLPDQYGYLSGLELDGEGGGVGIHFQETEEGDEVCFVSFDGEGNARETQLGDGEICGQYTFTDSGTLAALTLAGGVVLVDRETGAVLQTLSESGGELLAACGEELLAVTGSEVQRYDAAAGEPLGRMEAMTEAMFADGREYYITTTSCYPAVFASGGEGRIYYATEDGLFSCQTEGSVAEQLLDGALGSFQDPSFGMVAMAAEGQRFFIAATDSLMRYEYSADTPTVPEQELTVYSLYENEDIRQFASQYQKQNPNIFVNYVVGLSGGDGVTVSDALRTLNTDILAGSGPDLLALDGMSVDTYESQGLLVDLSPVLAELEAGEGLLSNVAYAYRKGEGVAAVPVKFAIPAAAGAAEQVQSLKGLDSLVCLAGESGALDASTIYYMPEILYQVCAGSWRREDGTIDQGKLQEYMQAVRDIYGAFRENAPEEDLEWLDTYEETARANYSDSPEFRSDEISVVMGIMDLLGGHYSTLLGTLGGILDYTEITSVNGLNGDCIMEPLRMQQEGVFVPQTVLGVLATSGKQEEALDFVRYALSKEAQRLDPYYGFPVNRSAFTATLYEPLWEEGQGMSATTENTATGERVDLDFVWPDTEELDRLTALAEGLTVCADMERVQSTVVLEEARSCMRGERSVEETVNSVMQKLNLYLAEGM